MKVIVTEAQYKIIESFLNEVRRNPEPIPLANLFNDNPSAQFLAITSRMAESNTDYDFKLEDVNGHKIVRDINNGTKTKGCTGDLRINDMERGNQFKLVFGNCGPLTINKVVGVKLFANEADLRANKPMDSMEIENSLDVTQDEFSNKYYEMLKSVEVGDDIHFDTSIKGKLVKFDGTIVNKMRDMVQVELIRLGVKSNPFNLNIDLNKNPFYMIHGDLLFKGSATNRVDDTTKPFILNISKFDIDKKQPITKKIEEPKKGIENPITKKSEEELKSDGKIAMDMILNSPELKQAFYEQPSLWNLFKAEMSGKKATGSGILPTLQLVGSYENKKISEKLEADFIEGRETQYKLNSTIKINYVDETGTNQVFVRQARVPYVVTVKHRDLGELTTLVGDKEDYIIKIKDKTDIANIYVCDITKFDDTREHKANTEENINIKFSVVDQFPGYRPKPKSVVPNK